MKLKDIPDELVILLAQQWRRNAQNLGVVPALVAVGYPEKLAYRKVEKLIDKGLLEYGNSPRFAWPTEKGEERVYGRGVRRMND